MTRRSSPAEQLRDNPTAAHLQLSAEEFVALDKVGGEPLRYLDWHQARAITGLAGLADPSRCAGSRTDPYSHPGQHR